jgi:RHS repeat-associated protein
VDQTGTTTYGYDALHRLTSVTYPGPQTDTYTYDAVGNRLTKNATPYTYGDAEEMLTAGGVSYQYDERGNQKQRGSDEFTWDPENRMTGLTIGTTTASYAYNGDGLRMSSTVGANTTSYVWDVAAGLPVILQDGSNTYVYGLGLISTYDGTNMTYRLTDGLGSTVNLCDASGNVLVTYTYDAFGAIRSQTGSSSNYWKFTGEQRDSESGFDYLRARYYDPETGRFLGQDPLGGGYVYVANNPANLTDPSGLYTACTDWREGKCTGTTEVSDEFAGMYYAYVSIEAYGLARIFPGKDVFGLFPDDDFLFSAHLLVDGNGRVVDHGVSVGPLWEQVGQTSIVVSDVLLELTATFAARSGNPFEGVSANVSLAVEFPVCRTSATVSYEGSAHIAAGLLEALTPLLGPYAVGAHGGAGLLEVKPEVLIEERSVEMCVEPDGRMGF